MKTNKIKLEWIEQLNQVYSIEALRQSLQNNYPQFNPDVLKKIAIIGAAEEGSRLLQLCDQLAIEVVCVCDDRPYKQNTIINGHSIKSTSMLSTIDKSIPIIVASHRVLLPIKNLRKKGHQQVVPWALLQILAPNIFPPHQFYDQWLESLFTNRDKLKTLIAMLADEKSLLVLNSIIGFRLTLNPELLSDIIDWDLYGSEDILNLKDDEIYIDAGTFDGDTIKSFITRVNNKFKHIIGLEPDTGTFKKLQENFNHEPRIELINSGLFSHSTTLYFDNVGTRASMLSEESTGNVAVSVTSIDNIMKGNPVTLIKMNIEGAEIPALHGAAETIAKYKPKLGVSIYHRANDLWEIPLLTKELNKNYKFYLRQHDGGVIESVMYAI